MENVTKAPLSPYTLSAAPWKAIMLTSSLSVIIIFTLFGNLIILVIFCAYKPLCKFINSFIVSLAVSDLLVGAVNMPAWIAKVVWNCADDETVSQLIEHVNELPFVGPRYKGVIDKGSILCS